jgi:acetyl esterase/lipase
MKNFIFAVLLMSWGLINAQAQYDLKKDVSYYSDSVIAKDSYLKSQCTLDVYYPVNKKNFATVVWFHGGGLTSGEKEIPKELTEKGFAVIGVGYRLSPKVKAPVYIEDAAAATAWVFNHIAEYGGNPNAIFVSGHSAGGYLGLMITLNKAYLQKYNVDANKIAALIALSGQTITHFAIKQERGLKPEQPLIDEYAPLYWVRGDAPPVVLITGDAELEMYGRYEENAYLYRMLKFYGQEQVKLFKLDGFSHIAMAAPSLSLLVKEVSRISKVK